MTTEQAVQLFAAIRAGFPGTPVEPATVALYVKALQEVEFIDGQAAVERVLRRERFWPSVAVVLDACAEAKSDRFRALPSPPVEPVSAEQAAENARRARELSAQIGQPIPDELPAVEGDTPEIAAARRRVALKLAAEEARDE